ncbi:unnamed protein product, partial [Staurois parvus]
ATGGNLPLGRGLGQQVAIYHWAGVSGNRRQPTTGQGPRATGGTLGRGLGDSTGRCTQRGQFRTRVVSAHSRGSSGHRSSVCTTGTVQNTHGKQLADPQRQAAPDRDDQRSAFQGQPAISRQQQLPGHSAADSFQGHAAMDSVQGPSTAAPRAHSSRQ